MTNAYQQAKARFRESALLGGVTRLLTWDRYVAMPPEAAAIRAETEGLIARLRNGILGDAGMPALLAEAEPHATDAEDRANLREMRRLSRNADAIDPALAGAFSRQCGICTALRTEARAKADFGIFRDAFAEMVRLRREIARSLGRRLGLDPYDALIEEYEPGLRRADLDTLFAAIEGPLSAMQPKTRAPAPVPLTPIEAQTLRAHCAELVRRIGFAGQRNRFDTSPEAFMQVVAPTDVRIVAQLYPDKPIVSMMATMHEAGHGLYEAGLPAALAHQPAGAARGSAVHESQALMMEMQVGRDPHFIRFLARLTGQDERQIHRGSLSIMPDHIRVSADETSYPLHIILRYRIEAALIDGTIEVDDVPALWNESSARLLGITPPNDGLGCLQDIHWAIGLFGYFPTYAVGAMIAAQLFETAAAADPAIPDQLADGRFEALTGWLRANVHARGSLPENFQALLIEATGRQLDPGALLRRIDQRYIPA